ncbi:hypothetical protein PENSPDRAFT_90928 [Peniophora sp. CONT]|nr:hypothetical protein PENSPDRAFT_90928 [Peniophora sp. CONT]
MRPFSPSSIRSAVKWLCPVVPHQNNNACSQRHSCKTDFLQGHVCRTWLHNGPKPARQSHTSLRSIQSMASRGSSWKKLDRTVFLWIWWCLSICRLRTLATIEILVLQHVLFIHVSQLPGLSRVHISTLVCATLIPEYSAHAIRLVLQDP